MSGSKTAYYDERALQQTREREQRERDARAHRKEEEVRRERARRDQIAQHRRAIKRARRQAESIATSNAVVHAALPDERRNIDQLLGQIPGTERLDDPGSARRTEMEAADLVRRIHEISKPARCRADLLRTAENLTKELEAIGMHGSLRPRAEALATRVRKSADAIRSDSLNDGGKRRTAELVALRNEHKALREASKTIIGVEGFLSELEDRADWASEFIQESREMLDGLLTETDALTAERMLQTRRELEAAARSAYESFLGREEAIKQEAFRAEVIRHAENRARHDEIKTRVSLIGVQERSYCAELAGRADSLLSDTGRLIHGTQEEFEQAVSAVEKLLAEIPRALKTAIDEREQTRQDNLETRDALLDDIATLSHVLPQMQLSDGLAAHLAGQLRELLDWTDSLATVAAEAGTATDLAEARERLELLERNQERKGVADEIRRSILAMDDLGYFRLENASRQRLQASFSDQAEIVAWLPSHEQLRLAVFQDSSGQVTFEMLSESEGEGCETIKLMLQGVGENFGIAPVYTDQYGEEHGISAGDEETRRKRDALAARMLSIP